MLFLLALFWLWRWTVRHEAGIRQQWERWLAFASVLRHHLFPQSAFFQARLLPDGRLGLHLTMSALVLIGASWLFGGIAEDVVTGDPLTLIDQRVAAWFNAHATPLLTQGMLIFTHLHGFIAISAYFVLMALLLTWKRDWYWLLCLSVTVPGGMLLNVLMKHAFLRMRPSVEHPLLVLTSQSFPSGHVAGATLFYGVVAVMLVSRIREWRWRALIVVVAVAMIALVALTRVYLGVHYLSDVLAAIAESIAWLTLSLTGVYIFHTWRQLPSRRRKSTDDGRQKN